jgi:hypothetical protein
VALKVTAPLYVEGEPEVLRASVGAVDWGAFNCRTKLPEAWREVAVKVTACAVVTDDTVAFTATLVAFAGIQAVAGTVTAALLLERLTVSPRQVAGFTVTLQVSVPAPVTDALLQESFTVVADVALAESARGRRPNRIRRMLVRTRMT